MGGAVEFDINFKIDQIDTKVANVENQLRNIGRTAEQSVAQTGTAFNKLGASMAAYFTLDVAKNVISQLIAVRGQFEQLDIAFQTILGSKAKADALMYQVVKLASETPFTLQQVASGAKQLLAFQVAQEDVIDTLTRLGNVASGVSVPIDRLILAYGQVKAKGKLQGDDLRQFTEAGIPMIHELAKVMGVADNQISKMVENGKIGFPQVQKVIENLTNQGGMFYNLMEKQSKSVTGMISNLGDATDKFLNAFGTNTEGFTKGFLSFLTESINGLTKIISPAESVTDAFKAQQSEVDKLSNKLPSLIKTYNELHGRTNLNKTEQNKLNDAIGGLANAMPSAINQFDRYGKAIGINTGLVETYIARQKALAEYMNKGAIAENNNNLSKLYGDLGVLDLAKKKGKLDFNDMSLSGRLNDAMGTDKYWGYSIDPNDKNYNDGALAAYNKAYSELRVKIENTRNVLAALKGDMGTTDPKKGSTDLGVDTKTTELDKLLKENFDLQKEWDLKNLEWDEKYRKDKNDQYDKETKDIITNAEKQQDEYDKIVESLRNYEKEKQAIHNEFVAKAKALGVNATDEQLAALQFQENEAYRILDKSYTDRIDSYASMVDEVANLGRKEVVAAADRALELIKTDTKLTDAQKELAKKRVNDLKTAIISEKDSKVVKEYADAVNEIANGIAKFNSPLADTMSLMANISVKAVEVSNSIKNWDNLTTSAKVGALSGVLGIFLAIVSAIKSWGEAQEAKQLQEYNDLLTEQRKRVDDINKALAEKHRLNQLLFNDSKNVQSADLKDLQAQSDAYQKKVDDWNVKNPPAKGGRRSDTGGVLSASALNAEEIKNWEEIKLRIAEIKKEQNKIDDSDLNAWIALKAQQEARIKQLTTPITTTRGGVTRTYSEGQSDAGALELANLKIQITETDSAIAKARLKYKEEELKNFEELAEKERQRLEKERQRLEKYKSDFADLAGYTEQSLGDAIMQGFENGAKGADLLGVKISDMLKSVMVKQFEQKYFEPLYEKMFNDNTLAAKYSLTGYNTLKQGLSSGNIAGRDLNDNERNLLGQVVKAMENGTLTSSMANNLMSKTRFGNGQSLLDGSLTIDESKLLGIDAKSIGAQMQKDYDTILKPALEAAGLLTNSTSNSNQQSLQGAIKGQLTEDTGSLLAGQFNGLRMTAVQQLEVATSGLAELRQISTNTFNSSGFLKEMRDIMKSNSASNNNSLRAAGL
jgi:tape measure domain-containing protein